MQSHRRAILRTSTLLAVTVLLLLAGIFRADGFQESGSFDQNRARLISYLIRQELIGHHFTHRKLDDAFSKDAFGLYLKQLDFQKRYLLQADVDRLSAYAASIDDELNSGKIELAGLGEEIIRKRVGVVEGMIRELLSRDFDFTSDETVETDPEKLAYCKTEAELKERLRTTLKYQVLTRYLTMREDEGQRRKEAGEKGESHKEKAKTLPTQKEAREKLLKSYENILSKTLHEKDEEGYNRYFSAVAHAFDPHTEYMPPVNKTEFDISMKGSLEGIGATLKEDDGFIRVVSIVPGSPAYRQGQLQVDDVILKVGEKDREPVEVTDMDLNSAVRLIRGKKGTEVRITVRRTDDTQLTIPIVRDVIQLEDASVKATILKDEKSGKSFGYLKIPSFYRDFEGARNNEAVRNVTDDVRKELGRLSSSGISGLVLDLRNNGGGALADAVSTTGLFIKDGPVVQIRSSGGKMSVLADEAADVAYAGPMVVLVNKLSASASEILAAALQDYHRAVIIGGERTHGKGTVQSIVDLDERIPFTSAEKYKPIGAMRVTTQKFYRVTGESTQYRGVVPDIIVPDRFQSLKNDERLLDFALPWDTVKPVSFVKWDLPPPDVPALRERSSVRVAANKEFAEIERVNRLISERQKKTLQSLNIDVVRKERETAKAAENLEGGLHGRPKDKLHPSEARTKEEREELWKKEVGEDVYVQEGTAVLADILSTPLTAGRN